MAFFKKKNSTTESTENQNISKEVPLSRSEVQKLDKDRINSIINSHSEFKDGKVIHTVFKNAIAFSPLGDIGIFTDEIEEMKLLNINDIKKIALKKPKKDSFGDYEDSINCILTINDFNNPILILTLDWELEDATDLFNEIKGTYEFLKNNR